MKQTIHLIRRFALTIKSFGCKIISQRLIEQILRNAALCHLITPSLNPFGSFNSKMLPAMAIVNIGAIIVWWLFTSVILTLLIVIILTAFSNSQSAQYVGQEFVYNRITKKGKSLIFYSLECCREFIDNKKRLCILRFNSFDHQQRHL